MEEIPDEARNFRKTATQGLRWSGESRLAEPGVFRGRNPDSDQRSPRETRFSLDCFYCFGVYIGVCFGVAKLIEC
jgi:hypothetical protein